MIKKIKVMSNNIKKEPFLLLLLSFLFISFLFSMLGYYLGMDSTADNTKCEKCEKCEECSKITNNKNDNFPSKKLGVFDTNNTFDVAKTYINLIIPISDITGKISDISSINKEIIFANYLYLFNENIVELTAAEIGKMGIPYLKEMYSDVNDTTVKFTCIKLSVEKFEESYIHIFGEDNMKYISTYLPNWKKVDNYYYYNYDLLMGAYSPNIASYDSIMFNDNNVEIMYRYAKNTGSAYCSGRYYSEKELEELGWGNESEGIPFVNVCGAYKKLVLNKNSDGTYYMYRLDDVN